MSSEQHRAVLVILEGGIASGKTSLGTHLQDNYNFSFLKESYAECELLKKFFEGVNLDLIKIYVFQFQIWILSDHMNRMLKLKQMILEGSKKIVMDRGILSTIPFLDLYNKKEYLSDDVISALKLLVHALWKEFTIFCNTMNIKLVYVNLLCPIEIAWLRYLYRQEGNPTKISLDDFFYLDTQHPYEDTMDKFAITQNLTSTASLELLSDLINCVLKK